VVELTADVDAAKAVYAELDLPAIVGQGDDILAGVHYHTKIGNHDHYPTGGQTISASDGPRRRDVPPDRAGHGHGAHCQC